MIRHKRMLLAVLCFAFASDAPAIGCDDLRGLPITVTALDYRLDILPLLRDVGCAGCHASGGQPPDLTAEPQTPLLELIFTQGTGTDLTFIEPFAPQRSYLFQKVNCVTPELGARMPLAGFPMSLEDQGVIYDWIFQGAKGERPEGFLQRDILFRSSAESLRY